MKRSIFGFGYCLCLVLAASPAWGAPTVSVAEQYMLNTDAQRRIPILVSSPTHERVEGVNVAVQIGDGGTVNGGTNTAPRIINLDPIGPGTIFNASNTGSTPLYISLSGNSPYLIASADTTTASGDLDANGVLAWLTVNPSGATVGLTYQVNLQNVGLGAANGPWFTNFATLPAAFGSLTSIHIVNLHQSVWNATHSGAWTDAHWTNPEPPYPNYTTQAIVNTNYTVDVTSAQEADSLALSNGGQVAISSAGSLALTTSATIGVGSTLQVAGGLDAQNITVNGNLNVVGSGSVDVASNTITGAGTLNVGNIGGSTSLTVASIQVGTLNIGTLPGSALSNPVPEPATITLLILAGLGMLWYCKRN